MNINKYILVDGWETIVELTNSSKVDDWIKALDGAEHLFRTTIMTKTNAPTIRDAIIESRDELNELKTFLEAREVYREIKKGEHDEVLDKDTVKDLLEVYFQALVDLQHPDSQVRSSGSKSWLIWLGALVLIAIGLFATGIGQRLLSLLKPVLAVAGVAVLGLLGLALLVLATFLYLDYKRKAKYRSKER